MSDLNLEYNPKYFYYENLQQRRAGQPITSEDWNHLWNLDEAATNNNSYALDCLLNTGDMHTVWDDMQDGKIASLEDAVERIDNDLDSIHNELSEVHDSIDDLNERIDEIDPTSNPSTFGLPTNAIRIKDYLYEVHYNDIDYRTALDHFWNQMPFSCSSFRRLGYHCRNLDWFYNNDAEFIVHTPRIGKRYASVGMSGGLFTQDEINVFDLRDEKYKLVPFALYDGINECGVVANVNVVPRITSSSIEPTQDVKVNLPLAMVVRFILDNFSTASEAVDYLVQHVRLKQSMKLIPMGYELHIMIGDPNDNYIVEFNQLSGDAASIEVSTGDIMTNFKIYGTVMNDDFKYYTPLDVDINPAHSAITVNHVHPQGAGLERYNLIVDEMENVTDVNSAMDLLEQLKYTNAYDTSRVDTDTFWYTEFVGNGRTVGTPASDYASILPAIETVFASRSRDTGNTWQTVHSAVYDVNEKKLYLVTQEDYDDVIEIEIESQIGGGSDNGDMKKSVYDTHNHATDIFDYVDNAIPTPYVLPTASTTELGGVKVDGSTISIDANGVISANAVTPVGPTFISTTWAYFNPDDMNDLDIAFVRMEVK